MKIIFSKPQVFLFIFGGLTGLFSGCATLNPSSKKVQAETLSLQETHVREMPSSASAEAMAHFSVGLHRELAQDYPGAIDAFQQAIRKDPENDDLYMIASQRLIQGGRSEDAFQLLKNLIEKHPENLTAHRWLAKLYLQEGNIPKAREQLWQAIQLHPRQERIYLEALQLALKAQDVDQVLSIARIASEHAEHPVKSNEILIRLLLNELRNAPDARTMLDLQNELDHTLERSIEEFPEEDAFLFIQAELAMDKGQWEQVFNSYILLDNRFQFTEQIRTKILLHAIRTTDNGARGIRSLLQQIRAQPESAFFYFLTGYIHEINRKPERALEAYEAAVELKENDVASLRKMAILTYQLGQTHRASKLITKVLEKQPDDPKLLLLAGQLSLGAEDFRQARIYFERSLFRVRQGEPLEDLPLVHTQLSMTLLALGEPPQSVADQMIQASQQPGNLEWIWQFYLREIYRTKDLDLKKGQQMEQNFLRLLEDLSDRLPENPEVEWLIGRSQVYLQNYTMAVKSFERFRNLAEKSASPDLWLNDEFYFDLAAAYERAGNISESVTLFEKIIQNNPTHHPSLNYLAYMWAERNENLEQALDYVNRALQLDPENGSYIDTLGWIYYQQERYQDAYRELLKSAELIPEESVIVEHLGDVMMKLGRPWEAASYYRIALMLDPAERLARVQESLKNAEEALHKELSVIGY